MNKIASTYAKALFDVALEANTLEDVKNDFNAIVTVIKEQPQFMDVLKLPKLDKNDKKDLIKSIFGPSASQLVVNFLMVLIDKDRIDLLTQIVIAFNELVNTHLGIIEGTVYSAVEMNEEQVAKLTDVFAKKLNQKVKLNVVVDPSLLGGYKVNLADVVYDNTIKLQLRNLKNNLMNVELK